MSIKQEKEKILKSIDPQIEKALRDGKPHRIEIEISHSKMKALKTFNQGSRSKWIANDIDMRQI